MIGLKYRRDKITYTPYLIFSQNQLHPSLLQFSNPPSGNLFPIPGRKQFERRRFSIIPFHPFKSTHYHPPSGSQNRFPDPYSAPRIPTETSVFLPKKSETNLRTNPPPSRFDLATHPVDIVRVFVMRSHCVRSIRVSIPRCLLRPPFTTAAAFPFDALRGNGEPL